MRNKYTISEIVNNVFSLITTKLTFPSARLIRRPVYIRGKKSIVGGKGLTLGYNCRFDLDGKKHTLFIGDNCQFGDNTHIVALNSVRIGNDVLIASKTFITDCSHGAYSGNSQDSPEVKPIQRPIVKKEIEIGDNVWIGDNCIIMASVGKGSIIGGNSVVTKNVGDEVIAVGSPARIIKKWDPNRKSWIVFDNNDSS